jgi:hypothetical protein
MNLFILSLNPEEVAKYMMDKHIAKIILEAVQMLCSAKRLIDSECKSVICSDSPLYKIAHKNHPVTIWCRASQANFIWTLDLVDAMHAEWKYRYNHPESKQHRSYSVAQYLRNNIPAPNKFEKEKRPHKMTPFALAMPDEFKVRLPTTPTTTNGEISFDAVASYRSYYLSAPKRRIAFWKKKRGMPEWYAKGLKQIRTAEKMNYLYKNRLVIVRSFH